MVSGSKLLGEASRVGKGASGRSFTGDLIVIIRRPHRWGSASENSAGFRLRGSLGVGVNEPVDPWAGGEQYRCAGAASIQATRMLSTFCLSSSFYCHQKATLGSERAAR